MFSELLRRLIRSLRIHTKRYSMGQKVSPSESQVLFLLRGSDPIEMSRISKELFVTSACATALIDRLVKHGLVERNRNEKDRRKVTVLLTDKGKHYLVRLETYRKKFFKSLIDDLSENDKKTMESGISILVTSLELIKKA